MHFSTLEENHFFGPSKFLSPTLFLLGLINKICPFVRVCSANVSLALNNRLDTTFGPPYLAAEILIKLVALGGRGRGRKGGGEKLEKRLESGQI